MCQSAGDFMADRFRNDVWAVMARHLGTALQLRKFKDGSSAIGQHQQRLSKDPWPGVEASMDGGGKLSGEAAISGFTWSTSERLLVRSILQCLNQVFRQEDCGRALVTILAPMGSILLPMLDIENDMEIVELAMESLKNILKIDCDVLWRPFLELSGVGIPPCPLRKIAVDLETAKHDNQPGQRSGEVSLRDCSLLAKRCRELMALVGTLPEQAVP
jgi:hypothetical protein